MAISPTHSPLSAAAAIETRRGFIGRAQAVWARWLTPRSTDRETAFVERTLRGLLPFLLFIFLLASVGSLESENVGIRATVVVEFIISNVMIIGALVALVRGQIRLSALLTVGRFALALITITNSAGYWDGAVVPIAMLVVLLASLILTRRLLVWAALVTALVIPIIAFIQDGAAVPLPMMDGVAMARPFSSSISSSFTVVLVLIYAVYQRNEFASRVREVNELVATLEDRVAERTRELNIAKQEAEVARDRAQDADKVKSQFLASMSHELRTPMNAILNYSEFLAMGVMGEVNEEQQGALKSINESGLHLLALINDVLDISKIQSGMLQLSVEANVDLRKECELALETAQTLVGEKPVQVRGEFAADLPRIVGDRRRLRQVLLNLTSNASKFTEEGSITLKIEQQGDAVVFSARDTGPGIKEADRGRLFQPFEQTETGVKHGGGTGLGLAISKALVDAHHGTIWFDSTVGEGTTFYVRLPIGGVPAAIVPAIDTVTLKEGAA